jgi:hypothetical protein
MKLAPDHEVGASPRDDPVGSDGRHGDGSRHRLEEKKINLKNALMN